MKKKLFSLALALALCLGLAAPVSAVSAVSSREDKATAESWPKSGRPETGLSLYTEVKTIMSTHGPWVPGIPAGTERPVAFTCYGLKDSSGNIVLPANYYSLKYLGPDRLLAGAVELVEDGYAVIDLHGNIVIPFGKYEIERVDVDSADISLLLTRNGVWASEDYNNYCTGLYDWNGNVILKPGDYQSISYDGDGFFILTAKNGQKGIYEYGVGMTLPFGSPYKFISHYKGYNLFGVMNQDGYVGAIDKNGKQILPCVYEYVAGYRNGCFIISRFTRERSRDYFRQNYSLTTPDYDHMEDALISVRGHELIPFGRYDDITFSGDYVRCGTWTGQYYGSLTPDVNKIYHYSDSFQISDLLVGTEETTLVEPLSPISNPSTETTPPAETPSSSALFKDVHSSDYFAEAVQWAVENNTTVGTGGGYFSPNVICSRGAIMAMIWRANGSPKPDPAKVAAAGAATLPNSPASAYYYEAVQWACAEGMIPATFNGEVDCTRATALELLWRTTGRPAPSSPVSFNDIDPIDPYADAVAWAVEQKITSGTGNNNFSPSATCTRGQIVFFLYRAMGK